MTAEPDRMRWARLTWQTADPDALAARLGALLGVAPEPGDDGGWRLDLGGEPLDIVAWRPEGTADEPTPDGRLVFEPVPGGVAAPVIVPDAALTLVGVVWATVDLDRAADELAPWLAAPDPARGGVDAASDPHLGARTRLRRGDALPGAVLVLAEPSTEGRLAASLARDGEGPCGLCLCPGGGLDAWLAAAAARGVRVSRREAGPLGDQVLLPGAVAGPHLLITETPAGPPPPGTIRL